ncbi:hypothetical protein M8C21_030449, partial [Ambrosia artemisiifolia]
PLLFSSSSPFFSTTSITYYFSPSIRSPSRIDGVEGGARERWRRSLKLGFRLDGQTPAAKNSRIRMKIYVEH